jgi:predicted nicotinamide N-methyase
MTVKNLQVLDICTGSGMVSDAAIVSGAASVLCNDSEPEAIKKLCERGHQAMTCDFEKIDPAPFDLVLAGDVWYETRLMERVLKWSKRAKRFLTSTVIRDEGCPRLIDDSFRKLAQMEVKIYDRSDDADLLVAEIYAR